MWQIFEITQVTFPLLKWYSLQFAFVCFKFFINILEHFTGSEIPFESW